jgi:hypothetical protein
MVFGMKSLKPVLDNSGLAVNEQSLFDTHGRCIPVDLKSAVNHDTRRYFICKQPQIDYNSIYSRITRHLEIADAISAEEFESRAEGILALLRSDPRTVDITKGVGVPFLLPKAAYSDIGQALDEKYLTGVEKSFSEVFPEHRFVNHHKDGLAGKLSIAAGSRHQQLVQSMQESHVVGYYFPALAEYSVPAAIEQVETLPAHFSLAGGFDTAAALIGCPDLLLRTDGYPPLLWLAALLAEQEGVGYHFEAYGYNLTFNRRPHFNQVAEYWASGLVVVG